MPGTAGVFLLGCLVGTCASIYTVRAGTNLDYGDAMAHLTISRRILDSKAPGLQQLGTVWLPLPHLLLLPLVQSLYLFKTGIAACILGTLCLGASSASLYRIMARLGFNGRGRAVGLGVFLANPAMLYACTTALTEPVLIACILGCMAGLAGWAFSPRRLSGGELAVFAGLPAAAGVLTRYEGWALVISGSIFVAIVTLRRGESVRRAMTRALSFAAPALAAVTWWLTYNTAIYGNPLEFLNGPYSAAAFTEAFIEQGTLTTKGNFGLSFQVLGWAMVENVGLAALLLGGLGLIAMTLIWGINDRALLVWLGGTSSAFLLMSLTTGQHIMINDMSLPVGAYNNRYVLSTLPWMALLTGFVVSHRWSKTSVVSLAAAAAVGVGLVGQNLWWAQDPGTRISVIEEGNRSSAGFGDVKAMALWVRRNYDGGGVLIDESSDKLAIAPVIGLPLKEYYNRSTGALFKDALKNPETHAKWVIMRGVQLLSSGTQGSIDLVTEALANDTQFLANYRVVFQRNDLLVFKRISDPQTEVPGAQS